MQTSNRMQDRINAQTWPLCLQERLSDLLPCSCMVVVWGGVETVRVVCTLGYSQPKSETARSEGETAQPKSETAERVGAEADARDTEAAQKRMKERLLSELSNLALW